MCTLLFAVDAHPEYRLVVAANRDEDHGRATQALHRWAEAPQVLAGRDLVAGGTWMGITTGGRFAALTNVRAPGAATGARSRGELVAAFLRGDASAARYVEAVARRGGEYGPFNLVVGEIGEIGEVGGAGGCEVYYVANLDPGRAAWGPAWAAGPTEGLGPRRLGPGIYGLSNHLLDSPWPKVQVGKERLAAALGRGGAIEAEELLEMLGDRRTHADASLPETGVGAARERALSALFVAMPGYGTCSSTALLVERGGAGRLRERTTNPRLGGAEVELRFRVDGAAG